MFTLRITSDLFLRHVAPKEQQNATTNGYPICLCVRQRRSEFLAPLHLHSYTLPGGDRLHNWCERAPTSACYAYVCPTTSTSAFSLSLSEQQLPHLSPHYQMERALLLCYLIKYTRSDATELPAHIAPLRICYTPTSRTGLLLAIKEAQLFFEGPFLPYLMVFIQRLYREYQERVECTFLNSPQSDTDTDEHLLLLLKRHHPHRE